MSAYSKLPPRRRKFVDAYLRKGVGAYAYTEVYGSQVKRPNAGACKLLADPLVAAAIIEREERAMENAGITRTRTWIEMRRVAYFDHRKLVGPDGNPIPLHELDEDTAAAIAGIDVEELFEGRGESRMHVGRLRKYRAWNKNEALKLILQSYGALIDRHEHAGPNGGAIPVKDASELSEYDIARRVAFLLARGLQAQPSQSDPAIPPGDSNSTQQQAGDTP
jgi:phage terminase small subunit